MAVFTKTYVQCDMCEQQRELAANGDGWYRIDAAISKMGSGEKPGDRVTARHTDICAACFAAIQEGEFSNLFFAERGNGRASQPPVAPKPTLTPVGNG